MKDKKQLFSEIYEKYEYYKDNDNDFFHSNSQNKNEFHLGKMVASFIVALAFSAGMVYAVVYTYNNIWKEPEKYNWNEEMQITKEDKENVLTDEEIIKRVDEIINWVGCENTQILDKRIFKDTQNKKTKLFITLENNMSITIDAITGELIQFSDSSFNDLEIESTVSKNEAKKIANEIYKMLGYSEGEYELATLIKNGTGNNEPLWKVEFCKKYDGVYNYYQCIRISFVPEIKRIKILTIFNEDYTDNEIVISENEALNIAKEYNLKFNKDETKLKRTSVNLEIQKMNTNIYALENQTENNNSAGEIYLYRTQDTVIRKVWTVEFDYSDEFSNIIRYYVDVTTGEIIGGNSTN